MSGAWMGNFSRALWAVAPTVSSGVSLMNAVALIGIILFIMFQKINAQPTVSMYLNTKNFLRAMEVKGWHTILTATLYIDVHTPTQQPSFLPSLIHFNLHNTPQSPFIHFNSLIPP